MFLWMFLDVMLWLIVASTAIALIAVIVIWSINWNAIKKGIRGSFWGK
jgi:hypothetical protein